MADWSFYLNRTITLSASRPRATTLVSPPWEAKLREGSLKVTIEALKRDTIDAPEGSFYLNRTITFVASRPRAITLIIRP